ncbi:Ap-4 complex accessory subunit tepsin-like [Plakobranchus ocellatus]|uniref:Ap-4 complex accessory subunit tepsin-like n=1 Tax=Plakobranchus ocellatus TaxID=259542 RepID=A0AAV3ZUP0_9GAST|nr:Ap-4 complex accessory subunit tepsin-like [Plakobranchus ocellatus]
MHTRQNVGFGGQKISFVSKINLLLKATSDDKTVTPGGLYKEINDITYEHVDYNSSLAEFLVDRLRHKSCHVKIKVLKLIKHLLENGSGEFTQSIRIYSTIIQECTKFGGPPDPMLGNAPYLVIRKIATAVCESLYSETPRDSTKPPEVKYGGLGPVGPVQTGGNIQGFGNAVPNQSKGLGETILGGIEKLSAKMSETPSDRQAALLASLDMSGSTRNYQPPTFPLPVELWKNPGILQDSFPSPVTESKKDVVVISKAKRRVKGPTPGKAGGGWGDDDDDDEEEEKDQVESEDENESQNAVCSSRQCDHKAEVTTDSLNYPSTSSGSVQNKAFSREYKLVAETLSCGSTGPGGELLVPSEVAAFRDQAAEMCCPALVELLAQELVQASQGSALRSLQLLEGIVYSQKKLISVEEVSCIAREALVRCLTNNQTGDHTLKKYPQLQRESIPCTRLDSEPQHGIQTPNSPEGITVCPSDGRDGVSEKPEACSVLTSALFVKSAKLILTLERLFSYKDSGARGNPEIRG